MIVNDYSMPNFGMDYFHQQPAFFGNGDISHFKNGFNFNTQCGVSPCMHANNHCHNNCDDCCEETVGINKNYLIPLGGIRLLLTGGLVAAWCIPIDVGSFYDLNGAYTSTRSAYIVVTSLAISISIIIFIISASNLVNLPQAQSPIWLILFSLLDLMCIALLIGVGVSAAVREAQIVNQEPDDFIDTVRQGAFATAGGLALFAVLLYLGGLVISLPYLFNLFKDEQCDEC